MQLKPKFSLSELDIIENDDSANTSPIVLVKERNQTFKFVCYYRRININQATVFQTETTPDTDKSCASLIKANYFQKFDCVCVGGGADWNERDWSMYNCIHYYLW